MRGGCAKVGVVEMDVVCEMGDGYIYVCRLIVPASSRCMKQT